MFENFGNHFCLNLSYKRNNYKEERKICWDYVKKYKVTKMGNVFHTNDSKIMLHSTHSWQQSILMGKVPSTRDTTSDRLEIGVHYAIMTCIFSIFGNIILNCEVAMLYNEMDCLIMWN